MLDQNTFSILDLFLHASIIVKMVMITLLLLSIVSWAMILNRFDIIRKYKEKNKMFASLFWQSGSVLPLYNKCKKNQLVATEKLFVKIFTLSSNKKILNQQDLEHSFNNYCNKDIAILEKNINFLATTASNAPFVGLFGTVWGIMDSLSGIAIKKSINLAIVAPGMAEALFTTALGLLVAIPASWFYNYFIKAIDDFENESQIIATDIIAVISKNNKTSNIQEK